MNKIIFRIFLGLPLVGGVFAVVGLIGYIGLYLSPPTRIAVLGIVTILSLSYVVGYYVDSGGESQ